jgi:importin subunit beta-1
MRQLQQVLILGLRNHEESAVCLTAVGVVGDCCRAIGPAFMPYSGDIVGAMLHSLQNPTLEKRVKAAILAAFGDIALALGGNIETYLQYICPVLQDASQTTVDVVCR